MNSELEVLKKIWENKKETHLKLISQQTGLGLNYTRYLCSSLLKKGQIKLVKNKHDYHKITSKGKRELKLRGLVKFKKKRILKRILKRENLAWPSLKLGGFSETTTYPPPSRPKGGPLTESTSSATGFYPVRNETSNGAKDKLKISKPH